MLNSEYKKLASKTATITLASTTTVNSTVTLPAGSIVTGIVMKNNALLVGAGNVTIVVDGVAQMTAAAAVLTDQNVSRFTPNAAVETTASVNGGKVGVTTSTNTVGEVEVTVIYFTS